MKTILAFVLAAILLPGQGFDPVRVPFLRTQTGLVRAGLVGGWDLRTVNLLKWSENLSTPCLGVLGTETITATTISTSASEVSGVYCSVDIPAGTYTLSADISVPSGTGTVSLNAYYGAWTYGSVEQLTTTPRRVSLSFTATGALNQWRIYNATAAAQTLIATNIQLNVGPTVLPYVRTTDQQRIPAIQSQVKYANGATELVGNRTNLLKYSEDLTNLSWWGRSTATPEGGYTDPNGGVSATKITSTGSDGYISQAVNIVGGGTFTYSYWVRADGANTPLSVGIFALRNSSSWTDINVYNVTTAWSEISVTFATTSSDSVVSIFVAGNGRLTSGKVMYVWHPRLSPGSTPSTYIKTEGDPIEPGYPFLQLGSTSGVDVNDPVRGATGLSFDGIDDHARFTQISFAQGAPRTLTVVGFRNGTPAGSYGMLLGGGSAAYLAFTSSNWWFSSDMWTTQHARQIAAVADLTWGSLTSARAPELYNNYINGNYVDTGPAPSGILTAPNLNVVGAYTTASDFPLKGTISFVLIYSRALTPREVRQNHNFLRATMKTVNVDLP